MDRDEVLWDIKWRVEPVLLPYDKLLPDDLSNRIANIVLEIVEEQADAAVKTFQETYTDIVLAKISD